MVPYCNFKGFKLTSLQSSGTPGFEPELGTIHKRRLLCGGGRGVQKLAILGDFQGVIGATGGGRVVKNRENWGDVVCGWALRDHPFMTSNDIGVGGFSQIRFCII